MQNQISAYPYFRVGLKSKRSVHHLLLETKPELSQVYTYVSISVSTGIYSYVRATFYHIHLFLSEAGRQKHSLSCS